MSNYKITLHKATSDTSTSAYDEILISSIATFPGYANQDAEIRIAGEDFIAEGEQIKFLGGEKSSNNFFRREYGVIFLKATYGASSWDWSNVKALIKSYLTSEFLWIDFASWQTQTNIAEHYHDSDKAIPVVVKEWSVAGNEKQGTKTLNVSFEHRWRNK